MFRRLLLCFLVTIASAEPFQWPEGYFNARIATDPSKPVPATEPGELRVTATHLSIGVEWDLTGDTNHDATCTVAYRGEGDDAWKEAMPLLRVDYEGWYDQQRASRPFNMLAGSVLFLEPGRRYEMRLVLKDPDGPGALDRMVTVRTKPWPAFRPVRTLYVSPGGRRGRGWIPRVAVPGTGSGPEGGETRGSLSSRGW